MKSLALFSLAAGLLVATAVPAQAQQRGYPTSWRINSNGYTGILTYTVNPRDSSVAGTLLGTPVVGFLVGRHLVLHRSPNGTQLYDGWILDPALGAQGKPYYDGTFFISGTVSELSTGVDGVYPWYGVAMSSGSSTPPPPPPPPATPIQRFLTSGSYQVTVYLSTTYRSTWTIQVVNGRITGISEWACCPGRRTDPMKGHFEGDTVVFERDCSGQNWSGACTQVYRGRLKNGRIEGTCTGTGITTPGTWVLQ